MKIGANAQTVLAIGGVLIVIGFLSRKAIAAAADTIANPNEGTPFEGTGIIGTVGNVTDRASGGVLGRIGSAIGDFLDPVNRRTLDELTGGTGGINPDG